MADKSVDHTTRKCPECGRTGGVRRVVVPEYRFEYEYPFPSGRETLDCTAFDLPEWVCLYCQGAWLGSDYCDRTTDAIVRASRGRIVRAGLGFTHLVRGGLPAAGEFET